MITPAIMAFVVAIIIFALPIFFIARLILQKNWKSATKSLITIISIIIGLVLSPFLLYLIFLLFVTVFGVH